MQRLERSKPLSTQVKNHVTRLHRTKAKEYDGSISTVISTGSTLLDLAISGGRVHGGGIPGGIMVEVFGPFSSGKTALLCSIAGSVQYAGGATKFMDPEARLNTQFARMFGTEIKESEIERPHTPVEVFSSIRAWKPKKPGDIPAVFVDSTAALASDLELEDKKDEYSRRAKLFSQECRKTCRIVQQRNLLIVFSNQVRQSMETFGPKYIAPGGEAVGFYSSLRLCCLHPKKMKSKVSIAGREVEKVIGIRTEIEVFKSSIWKPYRTAEVFILFDYGIDDIRENLRFVKRYKKYSTYCVRGISLGNSINDAIHEVENQGYTKILKEETIDLWEEIESKFDSNRQPKVR